MRTGVGDATLAKDHCRRFRARLNGKDWTNEAIGIGIGTGRSGDGGSDVEPEFDMDSG